MMKVTIVGIFALLMSSVIAMEEDFITGGDAAQPTEDSLEHATAVKYIEDAVDALDDDDFVLTSGVSKVCNGFCEDFSGTITCRAGCKGVNKAICYTGLWVMCKAGCLGIKKCVRKCERAIVDPCVHKLVDRCYAKCVENVVEPCERDCARKSLDGCKKIMKGLFESGQYKTDAAFCVIVGGAATGAGALAGLGPVAPVVGAIMGGGCGVAITAIDNKAQCKTRGEFCADRFCKALGL